jgi:hypothetical protein
MPEAASGAYISLRCRNLEKAQFHRRVAHIPRGYAQRTTALSSMTSHLLCTDFSVVASCRMQEDGQSVC